MTKIYTNKDALAAIGYSENCCANCCHFVGTDMSGNHDALPSHCRVASPLLLPVNSTGHCDHFHKPGAPEKENDA